MRYAPVGMRMSPQEILGESLRTLELRGALRGPETAQAATCKVIDHALPPKAFPARRSSGRPVAFGEVGQRREVQHIDGHFQRPDSCAVPALPGATIHGVDLRRLRGFPRQRVLAAAAADERTFMCTVPSVAEMAHAGEDHRDAVFVGGGDHFVVAHRAARLDDRLTPALASMSTPSRNGKKASDAILSPGP